PSLSRSPLGISLQARTGAGSPLEPSLAPLQTVLSIGLIEGDAHGADIGPLTAGAVPFAVVQVDSAHYFDIHHSAADTLDKVDPQLLAQDAAAYALLTYALAEMPQPLPRPPAQVPHNRQEVPKAH